MSICNIGPNSVRTNDAFRESVRTLFESAPRVYFWTFTFAQCLDLDVACGLWTSFVKHELVRNNPGCFGLRVYELHAVQGELTRGLHVHALLSQWVDVTWVLQRWDGRVGVEVAESVGCGYYLGKYLNPSVREECMRGKRLWAAFGKWEHTRVKDIEYESAYTQNFRVLSMFEKFGRREQMRLLYYTRGWGHYSSWPHVVRLQWLGVPRGFDGIGALQDISRRAKLKGIDLWNDFGPGA